MKNEKNSNVKRIVYTAITVVLIFFIWIQSCLPANASGKESSWVLNVLNTIAEFVGIKSAFTSHTIRKLAHFTEFAMLGIFLLLTVNTFKLNRLKKYFFVFAGCLSVAVCDECIQLIIPGRAGMIKDVILDFTGAFFGIILVSIIKYFLDKFFKHRGYI